MNMFDFASKLLSLIACKIEEKCNEIQSCGFSGLSSVFDASGSALSALQYLISCPLFGLSKERDYANHKLFQVVIRSVENILVVLAKLFSLFSDDANYNYSGCITQGFPRSSQEFSPTGESNVQIADVDLDNDDGSKDADPLVASGSNNLVTSLSPLHWKLKLVSVISTFFSVSSLQTWQIMFDMIAKENDDKVMCFLFPSSLGMCNYLSNFTLFSLWNRFLNIFSIISAKTIVLLVDHLLLWY